MSKQPLFLKALLSALKYYPLLTLIALIALFLQLGSTLALVPLAERIPGLLASGSLSAIAGSIGLVVVGYALKHLGEYAQHCAAGALSLHWLQQAQERLYHQILGARASVLAELNAEHTQSLLQEDLKQVQQAIYFLVYRWVPACLLLLVLGGALFYLSWRFTLFLLGLSLLALLLLRGIQQALPLSAGVLQDMMAKLYHELGEGLRGRWLVRQLRWESLQQERLSQLHKQWLQSAKKVLVLQALERPLMGVVQVASIGSVLFLSVLGVRSGGWSLGELTAFATALALAIDPGLWWAEARAEFQRARASWDRIEKERLRLTPEDLVPVYHDKPYLWARALRLEKGERLLLACPDWRIKKGDKWGLTGPSGTGKSTLLSVLACLDSPTSGQVLFPEAWRDVPLRVVLVAQETFFFHRSVRDNLLGPQQVSKERLWEVLEICQIAERIRALKEGMDTLMGENGVHFSGGEKQRLALARALLLNPAFLLLDEATTELDALSETRFFQALSQQAHLTCLVVSHQPRTLHHFAKIWHLEQHQLQEHLS
jgi:ABC-type multidrug transport system fused ATPase/permease subunit